MGRRKDDRERLKRIDAKQDVILAFLQGKMTLELESICQAVGGEPRAQGIDATTNGSGDGRLAEQG